MDAVRALEGEVRELVRRSGIDPVRDASTLLELVQAAVTDYDARSLQAGLPTLPNPTEAVRSVLDSLGGLGPLQPFLDDPSVEEIWINSPSQVFIARRGQPELTTTILTADLIRDLVERMLKWSGRRVDLRPLSSMPPCRTVPGCMW